MPRNPYLCQHARCDAFAETYLQHKPEGPPAELLPRGWSQIQLTLGTGQILNFTLCPKHKIEVHTEKRPYTIDFEGTNRGVRVTTVEVAEDA